MKNNQDKPADAAGLRRPTVEDWARVNRAVPRLVDSLPNGPQHYATVLGVNQRVGRTEINPDVV